MNTYIVLGNYTEQGIRHIKESPKRVNATRKMIKELGGKMTAFYLTLGSHDWVVVAELPDDETAAKMLLKLGSLGNVRTTTLRAFTEAEYKGIIEGLP